MENWYYTPEALPDFAKGFALPLAEASRPTLLPTMLEAHYKDLNFGHDGASYESKEPPGYAWDLHWYVLDGIINNDEPPDPAPFLGFSKEEQVFVATLASAQLFQSDWSGGGGQIRVEIECDTPDEALVIETVIRAAEAANIPWTFKVQ